jgi:AcrR family transcriptional regulator
MPKSFTQLQRDHILQKLLFNGKELFSHFGLNKTTVEELARKSGISKGAFYLFFASKEELFFEIIEQEEYSMKEKLISALPAIPSVEDVVSIIADAFSYAKSNPIILQVFNPLLLNDLILKLPPKKVAEHMKQDNDFANALVNALGFQKDDHETVIISGLLRSLFIVFLHKDEMNVTDEIFLKLITIVSNSIVTSGQIKKAR